MNPGRALGAGLALLCAAEPLNDPPGFNRGLLADVDRRIAAFFSQHLLT